jgi:hypothetical protein
MWTDVCPIGSACPVVLPILLQGRPICRSIQPNYWPSFPSSLFLFVRPVDLLRLAGAGSMSQFVLGENEENGRNGRGRKGELWAKKGEEWIGNCCTFSFHLRPSLFVQFCHPNSLTLNFARNCRVERESSTPFHPLLSIHSFFGPFHCKFKYCEIKFETNRKSMRTWT